MTAYKCDVMGRDCSECASRASGSYSKYGCAFCERTSRCVYRDTCLQDLATSCPPPEIDDIQPLSGPFEGGTDVTISGRNLGSRVEDVRGSVNVGAGSSVQPCVVNEDLYVISTRQVPPNGRILFAKFWFSFKVCTFAYVALCTRTHAL